MGTESRTDARPNFCDLVRSAYAARDLGPPRDEFLALISHELRNPLTAIVHAASLLDEAGLSDADHRAARRYLTRNACHISMLLGDLLDFLQFTQRAIKLQQQLIDLRQLTAEVVQSLQELADERHQEVHLQTDSDPLYVTGDRNRIEQAQLKLLLNAIKFTADGGRINLSLGREGNLAVVRVCDNGIGIPRGLLPRVFEPFFQSDQASDRMQRGMGLGLPLVRLIAEAHAGSVAVDSRGIGQGSEFTLRLPLASVPTAQAGLQRADWSGKKMVIVEDNPGIRTMLTRSMELQGFHVAAAATAHEGLVTVLRHAPDVAIIDIGLPDLDGCELARMIRQQPAYEAMLLVAFTGYGQEADREQALAAGFNLHLVKPLDPYRLLTAITAAWTVSSAVTYCPPRD